jgi:hypothetical protein
MSTHDLLILVAVTAGYAGWCLGILATRWGMQDDKPRRLRCMKVYRDGKWVPKYGEHPRLH